MKPQAGAVKNEPVTTQVEREQKPLAAKSESTVSQKPTTRGTAGSIDLGFGHPVPVLGDSSRFNGEVKAIALQRDGKLLVGGGFFEYNDFSSRGIARLFPDGRLDKSFAVATGLNGDVNAIVIQPDSKVIAGGQFTAYNGAGNSCNKIVRFNTDGSLDKSFNIGTGFSGTVYALALLGDGKLLVAGNLSKFNNIPCGGLVRLNSDGTLDESFVYNKGISGDVFCITLAGGKILAGGSFTRYDKTAMGSIVRLNMDGSLDNSFNSGKGFTSGRVFSILALPTGKILAGGYFNNYNQIQCYNLIRLNNDGSADNSFTLVGKPVKQYSGHGIFEMLLQQDGKIVIAGKFEYYGNTPCESIARINADGSIDNNFHPANGFDMKGVGAAGVNAMVTTADGRLITGGSFKRYDQVLRNNIALLDRNGALAKNFNVGVGFDDPVSTLVIQKDRKLIAGGKFETYQGITNNAIARLNADGTPDATFNVRNGFPKSAVVNAVAVQNDGKVIAGGGFATYAEISRSGLVRINPDGSLDESFSVGTGIDGEVLAVTLQSDGKILVGGRFKNYDGTPAAGIVRLNADGGRDDSFKPGDNFRGGVSIITMLPNGKIMIGGRNFIFNGQTSIDNNLAQLNANGSPDPSFKLDQSVRLRNIGSITLQKDGRLVVAGSATIANKEAGQRVLRLNADGLLDKTFATEMFFTAIGADQFKAMITSEGKIIVYGDFTKSNKVTAKKILRLNADGTVDTGFVTGESFDSADVNAVVEQEDGKLVAGGSFKSYDKYIHPGIIRLNAK